MLTLFAAAAAAGMVLYDKRRDGQQTQEGGTPEEEKERKEHYICCPAVDKIFQSVLFHRSQRMSFVSLLTKLVNECIIIIGLVLYPTNRFIHTINETLLRNKPIHSL